MKDIKEFAEGFLKAMDNHFLGHSLKKWLTVGIFWLMVVLCLRYTDPTNLVVVLGILSGLLLTLMGLNVADKKVNPTPLVKKEPDENENPVI